jgi:hypothetical protein
MLARRLRQGTPWNRGGRELWKIVSIASGGARAFNVTLEVRLACAGRWLAFGVRVR